MFIMLLVLFAGFGAEVYSQLTLSSADSTIPTRKTVTFTEDILAKQEEKHARYDPQASILSALIVAKTMFQCFS